MQQTPLDFSVLKVYTAESLVDGQLLIDQLHEAGICAELFNQNSVGGLGELPVTYPEVWIKRNSDVENATWVVHRFVARPTPLKDNYCARCGEHNPNTFEICWQCRSFLPETT